MSYVAVAYLAIAALVAVYVLTLAARQRTIADLAEAATYAARSRAGHPTRSQAGARRMPGGSGPMETR